MEGAFEQVTILFLKKCSIHSLDQFENQINEINDLREHGAKGCMRTIYGMNFAQIKRNEKREMKDE